VWGSFGEGLRAKPALPHVNQLPAGGAGRTRNFHHRHHPPTCSFPLAGHLKTAHDVGWVIRDVLQACWVPLLAPQPLAEMRRGNLVAKKRADASSY